MHKEGLNLLFPSAPPPLGARHPSLARQRTEANGHCRPGHNTGHAPLPGPTHAGAALPGRPFSGSAFSWHQVSRRVWKLNTKEGKTLGTQSLYLEWALCLSGCPLPGGGGGVCTQDPQRHMGCFQKHKEGAIFSNKAPQSLRRRHDGSLPVVPNGPCWGEAGLTGWRPDQSGVLGAWSSAW